LTSLAALKQRARHLRTESFALYLAARHPGTPWYAKAFAGGVAAYAFSPVDLIPDFIPVLGYLDDLILVPLGIALAIRLVPEPVLSECRVRSADAFEGDGPVGRVAGAIIVVLWVAIALACAVWAFGVLARH
jgi:uncharacterized membrane protein YkvA (DUF1232 family)